MFCELYGPAERDRQGFPISSYSFVSVSLLFSWTMGEGKFTRHPLFCNAWFLQTDCYKLDLELLDVEEKREEILDVISEEAGALATAEGTKSLNSSVI